MGPSDIEPALQAIPFLPPIRADAPLLTDEQRMRLATIATRVRVQPREVVYREESAARSVFIVAEGVVKAFKDLPSGKRWVTAFLYPADVFGLAENGFYVRTAQAVTQALLYRFDVNVLIETLKSDGELQFKFLCKLTHEVRERSDRRSLSDARMRLASSRCSFDSYSGSPGTHMTSSCR